MKGISGAPQPQQPTSNAAAWLGGRYTTFRLISDLEAVKVYMLAAFAHPAADKVAASATSNGRWFVVGDVILTRSDPVGSRGSWSTFVRVDWCRLKAGSIVNVGRCSPLFGPMGG